MQPKKPRQRIKTNPEKAINYKELIKLKINCNFIGRLFKHLKLKKWKKQKN